MTHAVVLSTPRQRAQAHRLIDKAPQGYVCKIDQPKRTLDQNNLMWALLTDLSVAMPEGRRHTPDVWKQILMHACGHAVQFEMGINGQPFPVGFRSSRLTKAQMSDLLECIREYGSRHGVKWSESDA